MSISTYDDVLDVLRMGDEEFHSTIAPEAAQAYREQDGRIIVRTVLPYSNRCKNRCLYCNMRANNKHLDRYAMTVDEILDLARFAHEEGHTRIFLLSGEDRKYSLDILLHIIGEIKSMGMYMALAAGEFPAEYYREMKAAGLDEYMVKFEMAQPDVFDRLNPSTTFEKRMGAIYSILDAGLNLASGNIIDYPGQTLEMCAEDIMLTKKLGVTWAPVIPYMPALNTPLAEEGGPGSVERTYREIALLRLMIPGVNITSQQPGKDPSLGLTVPENDYAAIKVGASVLFRGLVEARKAERFGITSNRNTEGTEHIHAVAEMSGMEISW